MLNKKTIEKIISDNVNYNVITNICEGNGINGVSFMAFPRRHEWDERIYTFQTDMKRYYNNNEIKEVTDDYIMIERTTNSEKDEEATYIYYIPYESIVSISIMQD